MLQKNGANFACAFLLPKVLQISNNRGALTFFCEINVKKHHYILNSYMCFQLFKRAPIFSHFDFFEKTSDKNQEQEVIYKLFRKGTYRRTCTNYMVIIRRYQF